MSVMRRAGVLVLLLTLAACGGGSGSEGAPSPTEPSFAAQVQTYYSQVPVDAANETKHAAASAEAWAGFASAVSDLDAPADLAVAKGQIVSIAGEITSALRQYADAVSPRCAGSVVGDTVPADCPDALDAGDAARSAEARLDRMVSGL